MSGVTLGINVQPETLRVYANRARAIRVTFGAPERDPRDNGNIFRAGPDRGRGLANFFNGPVAPDQPGGPLS